MTPDHPYTAYEGTPVWGALDEALRDLEVNQDVELTTVRIYVIGYLTRAVSEARELPSGTGALTRETEAWGMVTGIADPVVRNLVQIAVAAARLRTIRRVGEAEGAWQERLPLGDFDMLFFVQALAAALRDKALVRALLDGRSIGQAAQWDP